MAILVVAIAFLFALVNKTSKTPRARLESALAATKAALTADLTMDVKASFGGVSTRVMANGAADFQTGAMELYVSASGTTVTYVQTKGDVYLKDGSSVKSQFPGKSWVRMPISAFSSGEGNRLFITTDPQRMIAALTKLGASVTPVGAATIDGAQDEEYKIRLSVKELESHTSELAPSIRSVLTASKSVPTRTRASVTMYVNSAGQLQAARASVGAEATGHPVSASIDLTFSKFGTATVPAVPTAAKTVTYERLKRPLFTFSGGANVR